jgi:hypothetical protein
MLAKAFKAGWYARGESPVQIVARPAEVSVVTIADSSDVLEGTIQSRTLVAALTFFADQVLKQQPEETVNGEWLKADQISSLIEDVKNRYV